ncbi:hypothetical protein CSIM01_06733 [Neofusicoccum parvum]|uniref:Uncharacterized protein n=1 Tax=Neofusicoccum parvum TaxID=310453 RepID=A0ACB5S1S6_9PEZI|nr:hypothetical protein CSIM01_06733 [Neofusicoccum parvum]
MSFLQTLVTTLSQTVQQLERQLKQHNTSIDDLSLYTAQPSHLDEDKYLPPPEIFTLFEKLRVDARALETAVTPTRHKLALIALSQTKASALEAAVQLGVADEIAGTSNGEIALTDLAQRLGVNANKLGRILRILESDFIFCETAPGVFANTRHSLGLLEKAGGKRMLSFLARDTAEANLGVYANLTDPDAKDSFASTASPFSKAIAKGPTAFTDWLVLPQSAGMLDRVAGVTWLNQFTRPALLNDYPWPQTSLVDVGCGPADTALDLLALHPGLRVTALDLPPVVATAAAALAPDLAGRIAFVAHDYFGPDAMPGRGDAFFARGVLRDYSDDDSAKLLAGVREAMVASGPACRLLVNEVLTGPACVVGRGEGVAPSALLDAARQGEVRQSAWPEVANLMAQNAFVVFGGMERTREEMEALMRRVGFRIEKVWRMRSFIVMIECVVDEEWKGPGVA